jgi:hypothetical protein
MGRLCYPTQFRPNHQSLFFGSWHLSAGKGGYGALFAVQVQSFLRFTSVAVQIVSKPRIYPRLQSWWRSLAQCRGTMLIEASNLSTYKEFNCVQMSVSGCKSYYKFVLSAGAKAKSVTNNLPILSVL